MRRISVAFPCLSSDWLRHMKLHHWLSTAFLQGGRCLLLLIYEDIHNIYHQYPAKIPVNPTCVLPQNASVDGAADMLCLLIDPNKYGKLATAISCYDNLSCKRWCFDWGNQLFPYLYYIGKYFEAGQSPILSFDITMSFPEGHFSKKCRRYYYHFVVLHRTSIRLLFLTVTTSEAPLLSFSISLLVVKERSRNN